MNMNENHCKPFLITQIYESQNEFLIADDEILSNKQGFSNFLYKYIDLMPPQSCLRVFKYKNKIYLAYFILSDVREPRSNRTGIYLILGMSCSCNVYKYSPLILIENFIRFFNIIKTTFNIDSGDLATAVIKILWNSDDINYYMKSISMQWERFCVNNINYVFDNKIRIKSYYLMRYRNCNNIYILSDEDITIYISLFILVTSRHFTFFKFNFDYSDIKGYGNNYVKILFNGEKVPTKLKKAYLNMFFKNGIKTLFIEMKTW